MERQVIEFEGLPLGVAVPADDKLRFIAVKYEVIALDNREFSSLPDLKAAIRDHLTASRSQAA